MKIAVFVGQGKTEYSSIVMRSLTSYAKANDITIMFFNIFSIGENNILHAEGEKSIFYIPDYNIFDGIIVLGDTMHAFSMRQELLNRIRKEAKCPVVCMREYEHDFDSVLIDNEYAIYEMTNHFIKHHKFTDICFVTGLMDMQDAQERLRGYHRAMREANIPVSDNMIFYGDYWRGKGPEIVDKFTKNRDKYPQAIVCSNDYMAMAVYIELDKRGIRVPEDICVSGFDDLDEAQQLASPLSSIRPDFGEMAKVAIEKIVNDIKNGTGEYDYSKTSPDSKTGNILVRSKCFYRGSCGCDDSVAIRNYQNFIDYGYYRFMTQCNIYMMHDYESIISEKECISIAADFAARNNAEKFFLCLFDKAAKDEEGNTINNGRFTSEVARLRVKFDSERKPVLCDIPFHYSEILPKEFVDELDNNVNFIFSIHYNNEVFGYAIVQMNDSDYASVQESFEFLAINLSNGLNKIYTYKELFSMRDIKQQYLKDALTNIYNRRGFNAKLAELYRVNNNNVNITFVSIDMDGLKYINDSFGHQKGDEAIVAVSKAIDSALKDGEFCGRMGGDEFEVVLSNAEEGRLDEFYDRIRENLKIVNDTIDEDYIVDVSIGAYSADNDNYSMVECMEIADKLMYKNKNSKVNKQGKR